MRLRSSVVDVKELTAKDRQEMFALMQRCFANLNMETFETDLERKWVVIQVHDPSSGKLVGFSTQTMLEATVSETPISALFSGDTVVEPSYWGDPALAHEWGQFALRLIDQQSAGKLFWFLTSKGFRTYRYLPLFFRQYHPRWSEGMAHGETAVIDALGKLVGGHRYDPHQRIIHATADKDYVRSGISDADRRKGSDPHIRFFIEQNPGHAKGDELCCIAPLSRQNFTRAAYRVINAHTADREAM